MTFIETEKTSQRIRLKFLDPEAQRGFTEVSGGFDATIGALITSYGGEANSAKGYGKPPHLLMSSGIGRQTGLTEISEETGLLRSRAARTQTSSSSLGVYYKFNEGETGVLKD